MPICSISGLRVRPRTSRSAGAPVRRHGLDFGPSFATDEAADEGGRRPGPFRQAVARLAVGGDVVSADEEWLTAIAPSPKGRPVVIKRGE